MSKSEFFPPEHLSQRFHCPHCGVYAKQRWSHVNAGGDLHTNNYRNSNLHRVTTVSGNLPESWTLSFCEHCEGMIIWKKGCIVYPKQIQVELPNDDLSEEIKSDYLEAANILTDSPRAAAAILRLALQKLCVQLGEKGENINDDIGSLVKKGLNPTVQKAFDALRITGNNAVHPGEIDLTEDVDRVVKLFGLINFVAQKMLTEPKELEDFYDELPDGAKEAVEKRDNDDED